VIGPAFDAAAYRTLASRRQRAAAQWPDDTRWLDTAAGRLRVRDTGGDKPALVFAPDGPCVIEHYAALIEDLRTDFRVICFELPGFGHSAPAAGYAHRLAQGGQAVVAVLDALALPSAVLALSCVNGFYALAAANLAPGRVSHLVLAQTPGLTAMREWTQRIVPRPIQMPLLGQAINFATRARVTTGWYRVALAERDHRAPFDAAAQAVLAQGGCYCFAGVVQGMLATRADDPLLRAPEGVPVTVVWGEADRSHKPTDPAAFRQHCPQAEIIRLPAAGHFPELERPDEYAALLRERLLSMPSSRP
jgi:pimeloyl-ACP methyl ester carboxylesterase